MVDLIPRPVGLALKKDDVKAGMNVVVNNFTSGLHNPNSVGEITKVHEGILYVKRPDMDDDVWYCNLRPDGYWGDNEKNGYLLLNMPGIDNLARNERRREKERLDSLAYEKQRKEEEEKRKAEQERLAKMPKPHGALKIDQIRIGMKVVFNNYTCAANQPNNHGEVDQITRNSVHTSGPAGGWLSTLRPDGYIGDNNAQGFLLRYSKQVDRDIARAKKYGLPGVYAKPEPVVEIKYAKRTGYELDNFDTDGMNAVEELKKKSKETMVVSKKVMTQLEDIVRKDNEQAIGYLLGAKGKEITEVIELGGGGCQDSPGVGSEEVAEAMNRLIMNGYKPAGFAVTRLMEKRFTRHDSLLNNLKTWSVLFPGCVALLVAHKVVKGSGEEDEDGEEMAYKVHPRRVIVHHAWKLGKDIVKIGVQVK